MNCIGNESDDVPLDITSTPKSDRTDDRRSNGVPVPCTPIKYTGLVPITPMPKYDNLDTPDIRKLAKKYGIKQTLTKKRLQTKLKEVYLYNHQLSSPLSETPTLTETDQLQQSDIIIDEREEQESTNPCLPIGTPKSTKSKFGFKSKLMHHTVKHHAKTIDLTDSDSDDAPELITALNQQSGTCIIPDKPHDLDITTNVAKDSSEHFTNCLTEDTTCSYEGVSTIMPTISLLDSDSSTDSFTANKILNLADENYVNGPDNDTHSNDLFTSKECRLVSKSQSPDKSHELIDLTVSDLNQHSMEHSISDIFEIQTPGTSKEISYYHDDNHSRVDISEKSSRQPDIEVFNHNEDVKVCLDENNESSGEESKLYDEREKFHQSLFGSTQENSNTEGENSDGECVSLFQRIISKRTQTQTESSANEITGVSESENIAITDTRINRNSNGNKNMRKQLTESSSPPPKTRKVRKKDAKKLSDTETGTSKSKSKKSKLTKEHLELEMCLAIKSNCELHSQILLYRPIYFSHFKMVMKNYGIQVSSNELRDFLDSKGITFSTADENRLKGPRVAKKRRKAK